jgi:hypothetical protein
MVYVTHISKRDEHAAYTLQSSANFTEQQSGNGPNDTQQGDE